MKLPIFISTLLLLFMAGTVVKAGEILTVDNTTDRISLGNELQILEDPGKRLTISDVTSGEEASRFAPSREKVPYFGFTDSAYWVAFSLRSEGADQSLWIIELGYPLMDHVSFYLEGAGGTFSRTETGYRRPFDSRPLQHRYFIFSVELKPGVARRIYFRFENEDRMEIPLTLWSERAFYEKDHNEQYIMGIYFGILFFITVFHFLIFLTVRDRSYLYYVLFVISFSFFQLSQNGYTYEYFTPWFLEHFNRTIPASIALTLLTLLVFTETFLENKKRAVVPYRLTLGLKMFIGASLFTPLFLKYALSIQIQLAASLVAIGFIVYLGTRSLVQRYRPARFFMIAWSGILFGGAMYALKVAGIVPSNFFANYALQIGSVFQFILLSFGLGDRINLLEKEKEDAKRQVLLSEERYKLLVEGSEDIIFTLDEDWNIKTVNRAIRKHFKIDPDDVKNINLMELIFEDEEGRTITRQLVREKLEIFAEIKEPVLFRAPFMAPILNEPVEMHVRMEYINIEGRNEILGKATHVQEDSLMKYFRSERQTYEIGNYLLTADDISHRITRNLSRYMDARNTNMVRIALREILINAIEHGNLNITFEEKTEAQNNGEYFEFVSERQKDPRYAKRRVEIRYSIDEEKALYRVTDEGYGFDYRAFMEDDSARANTEHLLHGRGLSIAKNIFDRIEFNGKGNQILMVKYCGKARS